MKLRVRKSALTDGVKHVALDARALLTFGVDHAIWVWSQDWHATQSFAALDNVCNVDGAIIRLQPPADAADQQIAAVKKALMEIGAAVVRVDSRAQAAVLLMDPLRGKDGEAPRLTPREVVMQMAEQSSRKDELKSLLDKKLAEVGL